MRSTLNIDDDLIEEAKRLTGIEEKTALIREALKTLISVHASRRLAALGGTQPDFEAGGWPRTKRRR